MEKLIHIIKSHNLFEKKYTFQRNQFLKIAGSIDTNIYFVESGSLKISILNNDEEHIIRFGYKNDFIVSMDSFLTDRPSELFIQAIKKTVVNVIKRKVFMNFINSDLDNLRLWIHILENVVLQQLEREKDLLVSSRRDRYDRILRRTPLLFQEIPNKYIAHYLGMTPETLSRLKKS